MESPEAILPPPPPEIPPNVVPIKIEPLEERSSVLQIIKPRSGTLISRSRGSKGRRVSLLTNHLQVSVASVISDFYHYDISLCYEDGSEVARKNTKMAVVEKLHEVYKSQLNGKSLVYGVRSLFTLGQLPQNIMEFDVVLTSIAGKSFSGDDNLKGNDQKRQRLELCPKLFKVRMKFVSKISMQSLDDSKCLRILDLILQQQALEQGCLFANRHFSMSRKII